MQGFQCCLGPCVLTILIVLLPVITISIIAFATIARISY